MNTSGQKFVILPVIMKLYAKEDKKDRYISKKP